MGAISSGVVEGLNNKLRIVLRRSYGFRSYDSVTTALYHAMGTCPLGQEMPINSSEEPS